MSVAAKPKIELAMLRLPNILPLLPMMFSNLFSPEPVV
jgi:hypothetical protein